MSSLELEAGKLELIREIVNINSSTALESLRKYMKEVLNKNSHSIPTAADSKLLTKRMLAKYAGSWKDNRDSGTGRGPTTKLRQHHSRILRRHLHFRYGRLCLGPLFFRS